MTEPSQHTAADRINVAVFAVVLLAGAGLFAVSQRQAVSFIEKRRLAPVPEWSWQAVAAGRTGTALTDYYADHFEFRDRFIALADRIKAARGFSTGDYQIIATGTAQPPLRVSGRRAAPGPTATGDDDEDGDYANIRSVIVYKQRAVQISIGSTVTAARFARVVNSYHRVLGSGVKIYCMAIPVGSDFYLPHAINGGLKREQANIRMLYRDLEPGIVPVDAYRGLAEHVREYTYFRTDHHWTALGAYYAYRYFAAAAGLMPVAPTALVKRSIPGFLGSLYSYTRSEVLKDNIDTVDYYVIPNHTTESIYRGRGLQPLKGRIYEDTAKGANAYSVFIGGDYPLIRITSDDAGTRKILVIKDSYGNAFVPYLAANYGEIWVVDYRSFGGSVAQLVRDNAIDDVLIAHDSYVFNGKLAAARDLKMLPAASSAAPHAPIRHDQSEPPPPTDGLEPPG